MATAELYVVSTHFNSLDEFILVLAIEGSFASQHLEENDPQRPHICLLTVCLSIQHLGRHEVGSTHDGPDRVGLVLHGLTKPKVSDLHLFVMQQNVFQLEIPMDKPFFIECSIAREELPEEFIGLELGDDSSLGSEPRLETLLIA